MITNINLQFNFTGSFSCFLFYTKLLTSCLGTSFSLSPSIFTRTTPDLSTMSCMLCPFRPITLAAKAQNMRITPNSLPINIITTSAYIDEFGAYIQSGTVIQCERSVLVTASKQASHLSMSVIKNISANCMVLYLYKILYTVYFTLSVTQFFRTILSAANHNKGKQKLGKYVD